MAKPPDKSAVIEKTNIRRMSIANHGIDPDAEISGDFTSSLTSDASTHAVAVTAAAKPIIPVEIEAIPRDFCLSVNHCFIVLDLVIAGPLGVA